MEDRIETGFIGIEIGTETGIDYSKKRLAFQQGPL